MLSQTLEVSVSSSNYHMLENPNHSLEFLEQVVKVGNVTQWQHVAKNPSCSSELLETISLTNDPMALKAVAGNPNVNSGTIDGLIERKLFKIYIPLSKNPSCSDSQLQQLIDVSKNDYEILNNVAKNPSSSIRTIENVTGTVDDTADGLSLHKTCLITLLNRAPVNVHWVQQALRFITNPEMSTHALVPEEQFKAPVAYALSDTLHNLHRFSPSDASFIVDYVEEKTGFKIPYKSLNMKPNRNTLNKVPNVNLGF